MFEYNAIATRIIGLAPYTFFAMIGIVFAASTFFLLLLKYDYHIPRYSKIFLISGVGMLAGAVLFGSLSGLYNALANDNPIDIYTFLNGGIVFYGGMLGFIFSFMLICKIMDKFVDFALVDLAVICIPLFHMWGRLGCFFAGCCFGAETDSLFSVLYTNHTLGEVVTASRIPIQLVEAFANLIIFVSLLILRSKPVFAGYILPIYLTIYAALRLNLEFFRGDAARGVWNGVSFGQTVSVIIIICVFYLVLRRGLKERECGNI